jgi:hypothetical protein
MERLLKLTMWLFLVAFISSFTAFKLGYDGFLVVGKLEPPKVIEFIIGFILFYLQFYMMTAYSLLDYRRKQIINLIKISSVFVVFAIIAWIMQNEIFSFIGTGVLPCVYITALSIKRKNFKSTMKRLGFLLITVFIFQLFSLLAKNGQAQLGYTHAPFLTYIIMSFDLMILYIIFFLKGGVEDASKKKESRMVWKCPSFPAPVESISGCADNLAEADKFYNLKGLEKLLAVVILMGFNVLQWGFVMITIAFVDNIIIEALAVSISSIAFGFIIQRRYHCKTVVSCTILAFVIYYLIAKALSISVSFAYSQFLPVIIGGLLTYSLYRIGITVELRNLKHEQIIKRNIK